MECGIAGGQRKKQLCDNTVSEKAVGIPVELESIYLTDLGQLLSAAEVFTTDAREKCPCAFCLSELWQPRLNGGIQGNNFCNSEMT